MESKISELGSWLTELLTTTVEEIARECRFAQRQGQFTPSEFVRNCFNDPLQGWDEAAYLDSRFLNKLSRLVVERAVRMTFRRLMASF